MDKDCYFIKIFKIFKFRHRSLLHEKSFSSKTTLFLLLNFLLLFNEIKAQDFTSVSPTTFDSPMTDLTIVLGTGVGGAIIGLSTLSFVQKPSQHLNNILVGTSMGIIVGVAIVAWNQVSKSQGQSSDEEMNNLRAQKSFWQNSTSPQKQFSTVDRLYFHSEMSDEKVSSLHLSAASIKDRPLQNSPLSNLMIVKTFNF